MTRESGIWLAPSHASRRLAYAGRAPVTSGNRWSHSEYGSRARLDSAAARERCGTQATVGWTLEFTRT
jgi:hypothetical protein